MDNEGTISIMKQHFQQPSFLEMKNNLDEHSNHTSSRVKLTLPSVMSEEKLKKADDIMSPGGYDKPMDPKKKISNLSSNSGKNSYP
mmetsp:Transcript_14275/g.22230  ORF Transcript_14275/g.22230 Transcript_14275/m.22230 type:complete len:86 (+) Transcript_14275:2667-2924(+)